MHLRPTNSLGLFSAFMVAATLAGGIAPSRTADAAPGPGMGMGMQGGGMQGRGMQGGGMHGMGMHGGGGGKCGGMQGKRHAGKYLFGDSWEDTLSAEQKAQLDQLHVNFAKTKAPLETGIKALKVDLAILATTPQPDKAAIDAKVAELIELKGQLLGAKYGYIAARRLVLTPEQQISFDMDIIHEAMHGKQVKGGHHGGH